MMYLSFKESLHIFTLFENENSIQIPHELWFESICTSLRQKKVVVILEENVAVPTLNSTLRWEVGENWIALSPRSMGPLVQQKGLKFADFPSFKHFLRNNK